MSKTIDIIITITCSITALFSFFQLYCTYRWDKINKIKRAIYASLPRHDNYKFLMALNLYLTISWESYIYKRFFKPLVLGRMLTFEQLKLLVGNYDTSNHAPLSNHELHIMITAIKGEMYEARDHSESFIQKPEPHQYEF